MGVGEAVLATISWQFCHQSGAGGDGRVTGQREQRYLESYCVHQPDKPAVAIWKDSNTSDSFMTVTCGGTYVPRGLAIRFSMNIAPVNSLGFFNE